jgi:hypothetical protein
MNIFFRLRVPVLTLPLAAGLFAAVAGCGGDAKISDGAAPDAAVKESEAHYNAEIARQKAAGQKAK